MMPHLYLFAVHGRSLVVICLALAAWLTLDVGADSTASGHGVRASMTGGPSGGTGS